MAAREPLLQLDFVGLPELNEGGGPVSVPFNLQKR
jgi:hypothetical protein